MIRVIIGHHREYCLFFSLFPCPIFSATDNTRQRLKTNTRDKEKGKTEQMLEKDTPDKKGREGAKKNKKHKKTTDKKATGKRNGSVRITHHKIHPLIAYRNMRTHV